MLDDFPKPMYSLTVTSIHQFRRWTYNTLNISLICYKHYEIIVNLFSDPLSNHDKDLTYLQIILANGHTVDVAYKTHKYKIQSFI